MKKFHAPFAIKRNSIEMENPSKSKKEPVEKISDRLKKKVVAGRGLSLLFLNLLHPDLREHLNLIFAIATVVFPPDKSDDANQCVRKGKHIQDACIKTLPRSSAIFQIGFG